MPSLYRLLPLLVLLAACGSGSPGNPEPSEGTSAVIENRASLDMDVDVRRNDGQVSRLGFAPAGETTTFPLPATLTAGAAWVRFEAKPVRSSGTTVLSEPFPVRLGDQISWSISPQ
jgi:hypothetical protein